MSTVQKEVFGDCINYSKKKKYLVTIFGVGMALEKKS